MINSITLFIGILWFTIFCGRPAAQDIQPQILINELMADNSETIKSSDFQEYADWLELYNAGDSVIDLGGYHLTDDLNEPFKWRIRPNTVIRPGWRLLFWADSRDTSRHTNFSLSRDGEAAGLFSPTGQLVDSIRFPAQVTDVSFGRHPDGAADWFLFDQPTPGASNSDPGYRGIAGEPRFSPAGGFYSGTINLVLNSSQPDETLRYTLDGSLPTAQSAVYSGSISIDSTTVIRAQAIRAGYLPGPVVSYTYFIDEPTTLPVISIATDPANLWDDQTGIYVEGTNGITGYCSSEPRNWNQPWERPVHLEMYESDRSPGFAIDAGMQIGGGCTRLYPQKTLAIYVRETYGVSKINYRIFDDKTIDSFNNINLRNNGQDWWRALFRDGLMHTLVKDHMNIDRQAYKPAVLFLNGAYWGIHDIREKHNEHYLASNYGIDPDEIDILRGNAVVVQGTADLYNQVIDFIETHDMTVPDNYQWIANRIDIDSYLDYIIAEIYCANIDWPGGNIKYWRPWGDFGKWRWILFDTDLGFGAHGQGQYDSNTLENATAESATYYANPPWSTFLIRKLLENTVFRNEFIQRFAGHLNVTFHPDRVLYIIDSLKSVIEPEIPRHIQKWEQSTSFNDGWEYHVDVTQEFALRRPEFVTAHLTSKFGLSGMVQLDINSNNPAAGAVIISGVEIPPQGIIGSYFRDVPIRCTAVPAAGYRFTGWQGISGSQEPEIEIVLDSDGRLEALFERDETVLTSALRINEIMALNEQVKADPYGEFDDWIELFNGGDEAVDIGGAFITDDLNEPYQYQIPAYAPDSTTVPPGGFLLLWADNDPGQGILHVNLRLSGDGEQLGLGRQTDSGFVWIDTLTFGVQSADVSYGRFPDGADDFRYMDQPTPGFANIFTSIGSGPGTVPTGTWLAPNYPNPFNPGTTIRYGLGTAAPVRLTVYDITGRKVRTLVDRRQSAGNYRVEFDASTLPSGVYIYRLQTERYDLTRKMLLIK